MRVLCAGVYVGLVEAEPLHEHALDELTKGGGARVDLQLNVARATHEAAWVRSLQLCLHQELEMCYGGVVCCHVFYVRVCVFMCVWTCVCAKGDGARVNCHLNVARASHTRSSLGSAAPVASACKRSIMHASGVSLVMCELCAIVGPA